MTFTVESKSQLAKLMATENITVKHNAVPTACFDLKSRTLICPIWKDMGGDTYDLLLGHEVGHAIETPEQGWHNAVSEKGIKYKHFLNVVEDARIEKKIKRRYPGLKKSFKTAYEKFNEQDFFGIKNRTLNELYFIDRLNLHFKSLFTTEGLDFTPEEQKFVDEVYSCETWEDVVNVTDKIWNYSKKEQPKKDEQNELKDLREDYELGDGYGDDDEGEDFEYPESKNGNDESVNQPSNQNEEESEKSDDSSKESEKSNEISEELQKIDSVNRDKDSYGNEDYMPVSETDESFRQREMELLSTESKPYIYVNIPTPILENIITPAAKVHSAITNHIRTLFDGNSILEDNTNLINFKTKNERYISLLAKEFEMRKAAKSFAKVKVSTSGDLDMGKIFKYKLDDSIFRKLTKVPKGKSHGLVILLDKSGSMSNNMAGSIEQVLILTMFCRKVNIPFVVYGFGDSIAVRNLDCDRAPTSITLADIPFCFENEVNDLCLDYVFLREYLNSRMSGSEFTKSVKNLLIIKSLYENNSYITDKRSAFPPTESLSATPFNETIFAMKPILQSFKQNHNLDLLNLIIIQDGDADSTNRYVTEGTKIDSNGRSYGMHNFLNTKRENIVFVDKKTKKQYLLDECQNTITESALKWLSDSTGCKIFGFYITEKGRAAGNALFRHFKFENFESLEERISKSLMANNQFISFSNMKSSEIFRESMESLKKNKFLESHNKGYRKFYFIMGGDSLQVDNEDLEISGNVTSNKLKSAFNKLNKKRQVNRVLVSRFVQEIAV